MSEIAPPTARFIEKVQAAVEADGREFVLRESGEERQATCPAHDDVNPSLSIGWGAGKVVFHCQAGCDPDDVMAAVGLKYSDLSGKPTIVEVYDYADVEDVLVYQVVRYEPKDFRQRRPDPERPGRYIWDVKGVEPLLYNLGVVAEALDAGDDVYIVEGERDVEALRAKYAIATCNHGGAGKWTDGHSKEFVGTNSRVVIVADKDAAGARHALKVYRSLLQVADLEAEIVHAAVGKDAADHLAEHALDAFVPVAVGELEPTAVAEEVASSTLPDIEDGPLAEYVAEELGGKYVRAVGLGWLHNTGAVWQERSDDSVVEASRLVLKQVLETAIELRLPPKEIGPFLRLLSSGKVRAVTGFLRGMLEVEARQFDTALDYLNTPSGLVDLRTGDLVPYDAEKRFTKITNAAYDPAATSADWKQALRAIPPETRDWLQMRFGQAITGHTPPDDLLVVLKGGGENGKSTVIDAIRAALGDFAGIIPDRILLANPGDHPTELTMLRGLRVAFLEELPEGARFSIKRLKDIVGTSTMTARKIAKDNITWDSTHSLFVTTNYNPKINETDHGTWRRLAMVVFPYTFRPPGTRLVDKRDRHGDRALRERLRRTSQEAVLAWLVQGAVAWYEAGRVLSPPPAAVERDTLNWRKQTDLVLAFASEEFEFVPGSVVLATDVYERFSAWLRNSGHPEWGRQTFDSRFSDHTYLRDNFVTKARKRVDNIDVSRPGRGGPTVRHASDLPPTGNLNVWMGLAWRSDTDRTGGTG